MKKIQYETVNTISRNGCFTHGGFKTFANMMIGRIACSDMDRGKEVTKYFDLVMFRDKTTGEFPFTDLFEGGRKVIFTGRYHTREHDGKLYDEIIVEDMRENVGREVEVPDEGTQGRQGAAPAFGGLKQQREAPRRPAITGGAFGGDDATEAVPVSDDPTDLPEGFSDFEEVDF